VQQKQQKAEEQQKRGATKATKSGGATKATKARNTTGKSNRFFLFSLLFVFA